ncbi:UDP-3-O-[3-hydroxymyristoyl] glucosamine N-acyltransferase [Candidatus Sumerlaea chitinivorans]|uniref:UDP-3-O-acylglucosamine N-acyltransferase n=1 Tax=Sumerlaea chitinivorans TaxID=2250252 RepID=A0A2Z4Y181_SUMC1|nr:UDP-3-O-[3-hydroxymyristoyl] glucosamine N-acyltransferase [Candidatus Sumerlaea chitinivorans]
MRITELALALNSQVEGLTEDFEIQGISTLEAARPGEVSFLVNPKYLKAAAETQASAVIVPENVKLEGKAYIPLRFPWLGVRYLLLHFHPERAEVYYEGVHPSAIVSPEATLGHGVTIGPLAVIGPRVKVGDHTVIGPGCVIGPDVTIGENCYLHPNVVVEHGTQIGNRVIIQSGAVLGGDGFKFEFIQGRWVKIPQVGRVIIEDDVEIGANTTIDRASFVETRIGAGTKIDNLVQIAHNVRIGSNCVIVAQVGIAGSSSVGDGSILAAQAGIADNLILGKGVVVMARSGVKDHLPDGAKVLGAPARPFREAARIMAVEGKLPNLAEEVAELRKRIAELEAKLSAQ